MIRYTGLREVKDQDAYVIHGQILSYVVWHVCAWLSNLQKTKKSDFIDSQSTSAVVGSSNGRLLLMYMPPEQVVNSD